MKPRTKEERYAGGGPYVSPGQFKAAAEKLLKERPGRRSDFVQQFMSALLVAEHRVFFYGACVQLAAECVDAMTGSSWTKQIKPLYADENAARALVAPPGGLERLVSERLGEPIPLSQVRGMDLVLLELPSGPALGIYVGVNGVACAGERGIVCIKFQHAHKGWRVG